jgi:hypothetical protein
MADTNVLEKPVEAAAEQLSLYDLFIGLLTVISLGVMAMQFILLEERRT